MRRWIWLAAVVPFLILGLVFFRASNAARQAAADVEAQGRVDFSLVDLDRPAVTGIEPIPASPDFRDIAGFEGRIYVSGAAGLSMFGPGQENPKLWRAGMELPPGELGAMAAGALQGPSLQARELFIATDSAGLLLFDGSRFRQLVPKPAELRRLTALLALGSGRLLMGTETAGVAVFDGKRVSLLDPLLAAERITALAGTDQDLWIGTLQHGAWHLQAGHMEAVKDVLPDPQVLSLAVWGDRTYVGTPLGVVEFRGGRKLRTLAEGTFARTLAADATGLTIGTEDEGVFEVPLVERAPRSYPASYSGDALVGDPVQRVATVAGTTYALTGSAIFRKSGPHWDSLTHAADTFLAARHVSALSVGTAGDLWVGYFDRGLDIVSASRESHRHLEDERLFCVNRIVKDGTRTAVATANGLVLFGGGEVRQVLTREDGLIADHVTDVAFGPDGLAAATPAGISFLDTGGVRSVYVFQGLVNNHVYALARDGDRVLAGTLGGLSVLDRETIRANYTTANSGLKHNWITALAKVGDEWFAGTYGAGVLRLDAQNIWHTFPDLNAKFVVNPGALLVANGHVYAGSLDQGLYIDDLNTGRWRNTSRGFPSMNVTALASNGRDVYIGTANGAVRAAEGSLE